MRFEALELPIEFVASIRSLVARIGRRDRSLESQIRRAATSIVLNVAEGRRRIGRDRTHHYRIATGSAEETLAGLRVAAAWGYVDSRVIEDPVRTLDRIIRILRGLDR